MATGQKATIRQEMTTGAVDTFTITVYDGLSLIPGNPLNTIKELDTINFPVEGEMHIVYEDGCMYIFAKKNPLATTPVYHWKNCGRVVGFSNAEGWLRLPENIGKTERDYYNWLKNGKDL